MRGRQPRHRGGHARRPTFRTGGSAGAVRPRHGDAGGLSGLIRDIVRYGDPRLTAENADVDPRAEEIAGLIADMVETCHAAPGVGLAAPQIGLNKRIAIIDLSVGADPGALIVLVNPVVVESIGEQKEEEGCLSVPDLTEKVSRPTRVRVRAGDASGAVREIEGTGLLARALSHETDHLNGKLFVDRLRGLKRELTWRKIRRQKEKGLW
jgi:peptide deformylase